MADSKKTFKLEQTKGNFKLAGMICGITKEGAFKEGVTKADEKKGILSKNYRSLRFAVKTSPTNIINVELYGAEQDYVYVYSRENKDTKKVVWKDRTKTPEKSYNLIGINITSNVVKKEGEEPSEYKVTYVDYDAVKYIYESFNDGDSVYVTGEVKPNSYVNAQGEVINSFKYNIKSISIQKQLVNFEAEGFQEISSFDHEMIITDTALDKSTNKVLVNAYTIGYADSFKQAQFVIHYDKNEKLGNNFLKLKFGDYIKVLGLCINAPTNKPVEEDEWGSEVPKGYNAGGKFVSELRITAVAKDKDMNSMYKKRKYKEEDFVTQEEVETIHDDPNFDDESDDDLPFDV